MATPGKPEYNITASFKANLDGELMDKLLWVEFRKKVDRNLKYARIRFQYSLAKAIIKGLSRTPHWKSLTDYGSVDSLASQLGMPRGRAKEWMVNVLRQWSKEIVVPVVGVLDRNPNFKKFSNITLVFPIRAIYADYHKVLALKTSYHTSEVDTGEKREDKKTGEMKDYIRRRNVSWLSWLLDPFNAENPAETEEHALVSLSKYIQIKRGDRESSEDLGEKSDQFGDLEDREELERYRKTFEQKKEVKLGTLKDILKNMKKKK